MENDKYIRTIQELEKLGAKWWPEEVKQEAANASILQYLLNTQDKFISLLTLANKGNNKQLFALIEDSGFAYHVFLKHLMILSDVGSEQLQRFNASIDQLCPDQELHFLINEQSFTYSLQALPIKGTPSNKKLQIDTLDSLKKDCKNIKLCQDLITLLLYGSFSTLASTQSILSKCNIGQLLGEKNKIKTFVKQNYIRVSRIVGGKWANDLGNAAQTYAVKYLSEKLGDSYRVVSNGTIPGVQLDDDKEATFDIVVDKLGETGRFKPYVGIEVSFQETSNSTVERKGREARARFQSTINKRSYVAYIIDGAGNFSRTSAANDMCLNSHCNVGYTEAEFSVLIEFIKEKLG